MRNDLQPIPGRRFDPVARRERGQADPRRGLDFREIRVDLDPGERQRMREISKRTTVPQIFVGDHHVGGYVDMVALHRDGRFLPLLESEER